MAMNSELLRVTSTSDIHVYLRMGTYHTQEATVTTWCVWADNWRGLLLIA